MCLRAIYSIFLTDYNDVNDLKSKWKEKIQTLTPEEFNDPITLEEFKNPALTTEYGHVFDSSSLQSMFKAQKSAKGEECDLTCPLTLTSLKETKNKQKNEYKIIESDTLKKHLDAFKKDRSIAINIIDKANNSELKKELNQSGEKKIHSQIESAIQDFEKKIKTHVEQFQYACLELTAQQIQYAKDRLYLDINNENHLEHWNESYGLFGSGLKKLTYNQKDYHVSALIYNMMQAANKDHKRVADFYVAINTAKKSDTLNSTQRYFSSTLKAKNLIETKDLKTLSIMKKSE